MRLMESDFLLSFMDWSAVVVHDWANGPLTRHIKMTTYNPEEQYRIPKYTDSLLKLFQIIESEKTGSEMLRKDIKVYITPA